jgi:SAM-dependent methyltransferase
VPLDATRPPATDPTPIFEFLRGSFATELLTVAIADFGLFDRLAGGPLASEDLRSAVGLAERPFAVLTTALRAMRLLERDPAGGLGLTPLSREHLVTGGPFDVSGYVGLTAEAPGVRALAERLKADRPAGSHPDEEGAAFIFREGMGSQMEAEASARRLTLALAGRARNVAPVLAACCPLEGARLLVDVGGGTGIYSIAWLQRHPGLQAIIFDRPEVLKVAAEMGEAYGVADRLRGVVGDMFADALPAGADAVLLSNVLHDWDVPECRTLVKKCADAIVPGGRLLIHDALLDDDLGGPLPTALYSAALFTLTEGRAYSGAEYRAWLTEAGLTVADTVPTGVHCSVIVGRKPSGSDT